VRLRVVALNLVNEAAVVRQIHLARVQVHIWLLLKPPNLLRCLVPVGSVELDLFVANARNYAEEGVFPSSVVHANYSELKAVLFVSEL